MPLPSYDEALAVVLAHAAALPTETVSLADCLGRTLAESVHADRDLPPFHRSAMDGFAVQLANVQTGVPIPIVGNQPAGAAPEAIAPEMARFGVLKIATGAPVPPFFDAVIPVEQTQTVDSEHGPAVVFSDLVKPGYAIHRQGADAKTNDQLLAPGTRLAPHHVAIAAACGATRLKVQRAVRVAILTTGDEVQPADTPTDQLAFEHIRNSNGPMIAALAKAIGCDVVSIAHTPDEPGPTLAAAQHALAQADLVITCGGVSVGQRDLLPETWQQLGLTTHLHGVAIQPGKPLLFATPAPGSPGSGTAETTNNAPNANHPDTRTPLPGAGVLGLPGNPVSALACFHLFVWPFVRRLQGIRADVPWQRVELACDVPAKGKREVFRAATLNRMFNTASPIGWQGSGDLAHTAGMDGFVRLPLHDGVCPRGAVVGFLPVIQA